MNQTSRNASSVIFGFEYQINVAIYFMFSYLENIKCIRVEGETQDVEVTLINKSRYMIQAKAQSKDLYNNSNNSTKLKSAMLGLAESDSKDVEYLFYASNMINPLNTSTNEFEKYDVTIRKYNELSPESKKKIDAQINNNISENGKKYDINREKLVIIKIPFFGDFEKEKYKYIYEEAKNVLGMMSDTLVDKHRTIVKYCESKFLDNSATNPKIKITKEEFCNWIILTEVETLDLSNNHIDIGIDELDYYEAYQKYQNYVDEKISSYENHSKVYSLYLKASKNRNMSISDFVKKERVALYNFFFEEDLTNESEINDKNKLDVYISQILSYAILKKKSVIDKIKKGANL